MTPKSASKRLEQLKASAMWLVVGPEGRNLFTGDVFRVGRLPISVMQVCLTGEPQIPELSKVELCEGTAPVANVSLLSRPQSPRSTSVPMCRICLEEVSDEGAASPDYEAEMGEGAMMQAPCLCKGSNGMVHISCLRQWLGTRYGVQNVGGTGQCFSVKPPVCDICKTEFPVTVSPDGGVQKVALVPGLPLIEPPFIVFSMPRSFGDDKSRPHGERLVFAPLVDPSVPLKIGRSHDNQLRVPDVSVSRQHATVTFSEGAFSLKDNDSQFLTTIRPRKPLVLRGSQGAPLAVQIGRTLLSAALLDEDDDGMQDTDSAVRQPSFNLQQDNDAAVRQASFHLELPPRVPASSNQAADGTVQKSMNVDLGL